MLTRQDSVKYLAVVVDRELNGRKHTDKVRRTCLAKLAACNQAYFRHNHLWCPTLTTALWCGTIVEPFNRQTGKSAELCFVHNFEEATKNWE